MVSITFCLFLAEIVVKEMVHIETNGLGKLKIHADIKYNKCLVIKSARSIP